MTESYLYLVMQFGLDECHGVFTTPEKAQAYLDKIKPMSNGFYVQKRVLDKEYYGQ
jgi:hypothetical protein